jgi:predicted nucleic acid-binding protein
MIRGLVADTGFWLSAFDKGEPHHTAAASLLERLRDGIILMPWPIMYEVLRTRTVRNAIMTSAFGRVLSGYKIHRVDDREYRDACLANTFDMAAKGRSISLVDSVVRAVIADGRFHITRLLTFNVGDFQDICKIRNVPIWPNGVLR